MSEKMVFKDSEPGSLSDIDEIKILICYLLNSAPQPLDREQMNYVFQVTGTVNYFSFCQALKELTDTGHVAEQDSEDGKRVFVLTQRGADTAKTLSGVLGRASRDKVVAAAAELLSRTKRDKGQKVAVDRVEDGYIVHLTVHDIGSDLLDMKLFAPDRMQADLLADQCSENTINLYKGIISILLNDRRGLAEIVEEMQPRRQE